MAVLKDMSSSPSPADWKAAGVPLTKMMNLETRKGKANVPVIKKFLVDIDRPMFKAFAEVGTQKPIVRAHEQAACCVFDEDCQQGN